MVSLVVSIVCLLFPVGTVLWLKSLWLTHARTERILAATDRDLAAAFRHTRPEIADDRLASALRHEALAVTYTRRA